MSSETCMKVKAGDSLVLGSNKSSVAPSKKCITFPFDTLGASLRIAGPLIDKNCQLIIKADGDNIVARIDPDQIKGKHDAEHIVFNVIGYELRGNKYLESTCNMPLNYITVFNDVIDINHLPIINHVKLLPSTGYFGHGPQKTPQKHLVGGHRSMHYLLQLQKSNGIPKPLNVGRKPVIDPLHFKDKTKLGRQRYNNKNIHHMKMGKPISRSLREADHDNFKMGDLMNVNGMKKKIKKKGKRMKSQFESIKKRYKNGKKIDYINEASKLLYKGKDYGTKMRWIHENSNKHMIRLTTNGNNKFKMIANPLIMNDDTVISKTFSNWCVTNEEKICEMILNDYFDYDLKVINVGNQMAGYNISIDTSTTFNNGAPKIETHESVETVNIVINDNHGYRHHKYYAAYYIMGGMLAIALLMGFMYVVKKILCCGKKEVGADRYSGLNNEGADPIEPKLVSIHSIDDNGKGTPVMVTTVI